MNNLVLGLFMKFLATCVFCYATVLANSAFAVEDIKKSENNQFNPEPPQKISLPNFDKHYEFAIGKHDKKDVQRCARSISLSRLNML